MNINLIYNYNTVRYLLGAIGSELIRNQDAVTVIHYVSKNPIGRDIAWNFITQNWDDINKK